MVRLPKNYGLYDCTNCTNLDLYSPLADPETSQKIGGYCLVEK
jgi:hypothetical protein